jgi:hypothetical protein
MKKLLIGLVLFGIAISARSEGTVIINQPNGGQTVCIMQGGYVVCY